jgi:Helix-turn-helix domain
LKSPYRTVDEIADYLRLSPYQVRDRAKLGEIPHVIHPGSRRLLFPLDEIVQWENGAELESISLPRNGRRVRVVSPHVD